MTVNTVSSIAEFVTNGVTTNYPFYFKFLANEDLVVTYVDPLGISSELMLGTHYTVNGAGTDQGGSVVTTTALTGPGQLVVSREMEAFQQTSLRNQGKFLAETHEDVFDKLTMLIQQGFAIFTRALTRPFGRDYFYAENRRITNVQDPIDQQDAATRNWSEVYLGGLVSGLEGNPNIASGVGYVTPRGALGFVQDMSNTADPLKGAGYVARALRHINSLAELRSIRGQYDGEVVYLRGRASALPGAGGGNFVWVAASSAADDDGCTISAAGVGRWLRQIESFEIDASWYGASSALADATSVIQAAVNAANFYGLKIVRLPGTGYFKVGALTGVSGITFVGRGAFFDGRPYIVVQDMIQDLREVVLPAAYAWFPGKVYANGMPGQAVQTADVETMWQDNEVQGLVVYYVSTAGSDGNTGTGPNAPLLNLTAAIAKADVGVIKMFPGEYFAATSIGTAIGVSVNRDIQIESYSGGKDVIIHTGPDSSSITWTVGGTQTYSAPTGMSINQAFDNSCIDVNGDPLRLVLRTSIALVTANPGSWFYDSGTGRVHIRLASGASPSGKAVLFGSGAGTITGNRAMFLKNVRIHGGGLVIGDSGGVKPRLYAKGCDFKYGANNNVQTLAGDFYHQDCTFGLAGLDNLNYHDNGSLTSRALEINCKSYGAGYFLAGGVDSNNASSMHDNGVVLRINGVYSGSYGPNIPDTGNSVSWNIGVTARNSLPPTAAQNSGFYTELAMTLIDCAASGNTNDLRVGSGGVMSLRNVQTGGTSLLEGTGKLQQI